MLAHTQSGTLEGIERGGVSAFLGVPYAASPTGALRWRPPQAPMAWAGVRPARTFGNAAAQSPLPGGILGVAEPLDEDCLYLNVWTPGIDAAARPVMVWLHGGSKQVDPALMTAGPSNATQLVAAAVHTDLNARVPVIRLLEAQRAHACVHHYVFTWTSPQGDGSTGAPHGGEIALVFGTHDLSAETRRMFGAGPAADALSNAMQDAWVAFARVGDPSTQALGPWPAYGETRSTQLIGELCEVAEDPWGTERALWDGYDDAAIMPAYLVQGLAP